MKSITIKSQRNTITYLIFVGIMLTSLIGVSAVKTEKLRKQGDEIIEDAIYTLEENMFVDLSVNIDQVRNTGKVILGIDKFNSAFNKSAKDIEITVDVVKWIDPNTSVTVCQGKSLSVSYNPKSSYNDLCLFKIDDCRKIQVQVKTIFVGGVSIKNLSSCPYVFLDLEVETERYYPFNISASVSNVDHTYQNTSDKLEVYWDTFEGAEAYELEWTAVDNYAFSDVTGQLITADPGSIDCDFENNSTRLLTSGNYYSLPLTFDRGYLLYRVRAVSKSSEDKDIYVYSNWSAPDKGTVNIFSDKYQINEAHESEKSWIYNSKYAENGLKKETVEYFDGALKNRQTISVLNTQNEVIAQEVIYDYLGRPAISVLPAPTNSNILKYYENFNVNKFLEPYSYSDFDTDDGCNVVTSFMSSEESGAAKYYSAMTSYDQETEGHQAYLPDADGFPFVQTEYTPDNTGRIRRQGAAGPDFQLSTDSPQNHDTKYYYSQPTQLELDRLFGTDAGLAHHYRKNMMFDPNGQLSVSYIDLAGNTIATALTGDTPSSLEGLPSLIATGNRVITNLIEFNKPSVYNLINGNSIDLTYQVMVPEAGYYDITYRPEYVNYTPDCSNISICFDGIFDIEISIVDECGGELLPGGKYESTFGDLSSLDDICSEYTTVNAPFNTFLPEAGTYTLSKKLTINQEAFDAYTDMFMNNPDNECLPDLQSMLQNAIDQIDLTVCNFDCQAVGGCTGSLGVDYDDHLDKFGGNALTQEEYEKAMLECIEICEQSSPAQSNTIIQTLLSDVYPGGQYAAYEYDDNGNMVADDFELSILNESNHLPGTIIEITEYPDANWKNPIGNYLDKNDNIAYVPLTEIGTGEYLPAIEAGATVVYVKYNEITGSYELPGDIPAVVPQELVNLTDFVTYFEESWANALVKYHPEYCYYEWLEGNNIDEDSYTNSDEYDNMILEEETYLGANSTFGLTGYSDITDLVDVDPYFNVISGITGQGVNQKQQMIDFLNQAGQNTNGDYYNIKEMISVLTHCDVAYDDNSDLPVITDPCLQNIWTGLDNVSPDYEWELYKHMYLKYKQMLQQDAAHEYAINTGNGYNGCIGIGDNGFNHADKGFGDEYDNVWQPCNSNTHNYYASKQRRFIDRDFESGIPAYEEGGEQYAEDLQNLAEGTVLLTTGQCPITVHIANLLNNLASTDDLTSPSVELIRNRAFTPLLYNELDPPSGYVIQYKWQASVNTSTGNLECVFFDGWVADGYINFEWLNTPACDWDDIIYFFNFQFAELGAGGNYKFRVSVIYENADGSTGQALLFGETSYELDNCSSSSFEYHEPTDLALDMLSLWNIILEQDNDIIFKGQEVVINNSPFKEFLSPVLTDQLSHFCDGQSNHYTWTMVNNNNWRIKCTDNTTGCIDQTDIEITFPPPGSVIDYSNNLLYFKDIKCLESDPHKFRVTAVYDNSGTIEETLFEGKVIMVSPVPPSYEVPMFEKDLDFLLCEQTEAKVKNDLEGFLSWLAEEDALVINRSIEHCTEFTDLLRSYVHSSTNMWYVDNVSSTTLNACLAFEDSPPLLSRYCDVTLNTFDCNELINFSEITGFQNMNAVFTDNSNGLTTSEFIVDAIIPGSGVVKLYGSTTCYPLMNCNDCYGFKLPFTKETCTSDYQDLLSSITTSYFVEFFGEKDRFCELNLGYCTDDYLFYLSQINSRLSADLLNMQDPQLHPMFISLEEFCTNGLSYSENSTTPYYTQFLDAVITIHSDYPIGPLVIGKSPYFLTLSEFNELNLTECVLCYADFIDGLAGDPEHLITIEEFTKNNMCTKIPRDICPKMPPNTFMSPTSPFVNPCEQDLVAVTKAGVYNEYYELLKAAKDKFTNEYQSGCLLVNEELKVELVEAEYHYTLYYYDRAGNLVKTIPPEGVKPISDPDALNDITTIRELNGTSSIVPSHILPTTYRYDSRGLLVEQNSPDAGQTIYIYDLLGRLRFSQNAKQNTTGYFTYTCYDELGRVCETGESNETFEGVILIDDDVLTDLILMDNSYPSTGKRNITKTTYDNSSTGWFEQENLRSRVSSVTYDKEGDDNYDYGTHYSYDIHGNVKTLVQENVDLKGTENYHKRIDYKYDLVSGNVNKVSYQHQKDDAAYHKYYYDADNRITEVFTSRDDMIWKRDARYIYYKHGPLARIELGDSKVQGIDYAYTINGWLKGVNSTTLEAHRDIGKDGSNTGIHQNIGRDAYGFSLGYYDNDYDQIDPSIFDEFFIAGNGDNTVDPLYNGNISSMSSTTHQYKPKDRLEAQSWQATPSLAHFKYDQLNRLVQTKVYSNENVIASNNWAGYSNPGIEAYNTEYEYDANGNILTLQRNGIPTQEPMDDLGYIYDRVNPLDNTSDLLSNKLLYVTDAVTNSGYDNDITNQSSGNYDYDEIGNLISDNSEEIDEISWNVANKIESIKRDYGSYKLKVDYSYDGLGNRIYKKSYQTAGFTDEIDHTWYVRDARGNIMAVYRWTSPETPQLSELSIYGSSRLGYADVSSESGSGTGTTDFYHTTGLRKYELTNHLGNVMTVVSDRPVANAIDPINDDVIDHYTANFISSQNYYPFGSIVPGTNTNTDEYRFGFNGKEKDDEVSGTGNQYDYGFRIYNPRIARFLSVDPLSDSYPWYTPYQFAGNTPVEAIDMDGLEEFHTQRGNLTPTTHMDYLNGWQNLGHNFYALIYNSFAAPIYNSSSFVINSVVAPKNSYENLKDAYSNLNNKLVQLPEDIITTPVTKEGLIYSFTSWENYEAPLGLVSGGLVYKTFTSKFVVTKSPRFETMYRVQGGGSKHRFIINDSQIALQGDDMLFVNFGDKSRALQFLAQRGEEAVVLKFKVKKSFFDKIKKESVEQRAGRKFPDKPQMVDPSKASYQYGIPNNYFYELLENIEEGTIEIITK